jgi:chemotaxis signal transduction protein
MVQIATRTESQHQPGSAPISVATERLVRCQVGGSPFVLPLERIAEVVALGAATATAPRGWIGTLVRNERPVPIGDLAFLLGLTPTITTRRVVRAVILRGGTSGGLFGVTVESVPTVLNADTARPEPVPAIARRGGAGLVQGTLIHNDELLLVLNADVIIERLAAGLTRQSDGRITELRALPRRAASDTGRFLAADRPRPQFAPPKRDLQALLVTGMETADGGSGFIPAVPMNWVQEVRPWQEPRVLPQAPASLIGLITWRGRVLPVLDLTQRLTGIPGTEVVGGKRRLLIVGPQGSPPLGALLIPGVRGLQTLSADAPGTPPALPDTLDRALLSAWTRHGDDAVAVLDPAAFFA